MFIKFCKVLTLNEMLQKENNVQELPKKIMVCLPSLNLHGFKFGLVSRDVIFLLIVPKSMRRKKTFTTLLPM